MKARTLLLGSLATANLLCTLGFQLLVLRHWSAGSQTDAFFAANTVPQILITVLVGAAINVVVPQFAIHDLDEGGRGQAWALLLVTGSLLSALAVPILVFADRVVALTAPGLPPLALGEAAQVLRVNSLAFPCAGLASLATGIHQGLHRFVFAEAVSISANLGLLLFSLFSLDQLTLVSVSWLSAARWLILLLALIAPFSWPRVTRQDFSAARITMDRMRPLLMSTAYFKLSPLLDRWIASWGSPGDISLLQVLNQLFAGLAAISGRSLVTPLTAGLARLNQTGASLAERAELYDRLQARVAVLCTAAWLALIVASLALGDVLLGPGKGWRCTRLLLAFGGLFTAGFLGQLAAAWFYAEGDTRTPSAVGAVGFTVGIIIRVATYPVIGTLGIALGTSMSQAINWLLLRSRIHRSRLAKAH